MSADCQRWYIVLDIGGTNFRIGRYEAQSDRLVEVRRYPTPNYLRLPGATVEEIQVRLVADITARVAEQARLVQAAVVGIAFAGPVNAAGEVITAPTIWGRPGAPLPLGERVTHSVGLPVHVVNDVTAAAWRYSCQEDEPFCVITVSSGIGNKVFHHGEVLLGPNGEGGEIGHFCCDLSDDALPCDCGGVGHLGAIASGRGIVRFAHQLAQQDPSAFAVSTLAAGGATSALTSHRIAEAVRAADPFALAVLKRSLSYLASTITAIYTAIGVRRYILIGGFAQAVGNLYIEGLQAELHRIGCFGLSEAALAKMVRFGECDDNDGLIGAGIYLHRFYRDTLVD